MELKIINQSADTVNGQFGITEQRTGELVQHLNTIVNNGVDGLPKTKVYNDIANFCTTTEELVMCIAAFGEWASETVYQ